MVRLFMEEGNNLKRFVKLFVMHRYLLFGTILSVLKLSIEIIIFDKGNNYRTHWTWKGFWDWTTNSTISKGFSPKTKSFYTRKTFVHRRVEKFQRLLPLCWRYLQRPDLSIIFNPIHNTTVTQVNQKIQTDGLVSDKGDLIRFNSNKIK